MGIDVKSERKRFFNPLKIANFAALNQSIMQQTTNTILMVRPVNFRMNEQTAVNNYYQKVLDNLLPDTVNAKAQQEFDDYVEKLRQIGVNVVVIDDTNDFDTPDSIFPNNWISFHENGTVALYPMFAENRRHERREDVLTLLEEKGFKIDHVVDYTSAEEEELFLEGTGSLLLDRANRKAYCALSPRADEGLFIEFCEDFEYTPVVFTAYQTVNDQRKAIYHTNVMMCLAETFAVICLDAIDDKKERKNIVDHLKADGKEVIAITEAQVNNFAGNMLQVKGDNNQKYLVMSQAAFNALTQDQITAIEKHCNILSSSLDTIEACGGGSARCMMAEVFLPKG
ncbi:hypothetical protein GCM10011364_21220 [Mangrovimonas yunxiaonensis]|nr:hypothetical protein GCM10011364_21220 [Mangrovimonas yunxiaonensis]